MVIRRAKRSDLSQLARLFDLYRQFYDRPPDLGVARRFIGARLRNRDSILLLAETRGPGKSRAAVGFTQIYPSFSSVSACPIWILNDLYVSDDARTRGVGRALLEAVRVRAAAARVQRIELSTAVDNEPARALYASLGYERVEGFDTFQVVVRRTGPARIA